MILYFIHFVTVQPPPAKRFCMVLNRYHLSENNSGKMSFGCPEGEKMNWERDCEDGAAGEVYVFLGLVSLVWGGRI